MKEKMKAKKQVGADAEPSLKKYKFDSESV